MCNENTLSVNYYLVTGGIFKSLDLRSIEVSEDPKELTNSSPLKTVNNLPPFTELSAPNFS